MALNRAARLRAARCSLRSLATSISTTNHASDQADASTQADTGQAEHVTSPSRPSRPSTSDSAGPGRERPAVCDPPAQADQRPPPPLIF